MPIARRTALPAVVLLAFASSGCSLSTSSGAISDSVSSPFTSISKSSKSSKSSKPSAQSYVNDVRDYTAGYVSGGGSTTEGLRYGIADVAARHGITNWTANMDSFVGVGMGLAKAGVQGSRYLGFRDGIAGRSSGAAAAIDSGYKTGGR